MEQFNNQSQQAYPESSSSCVDNSYIDSPPGYVILSNEVDSTQRQQSPDSLNSLLYNNNEIKQEPLEPTSSTTGCTYPAPAGSLLCSLLSKSSSTGPTSRSSRNQQHPTSQSGSQSSQLLAYLNSTSSQNGSDSSVHHKHKQQHLNYNSQQSGRQASANAMKFESQSRASSTQSHLAAEPHSSQGNSQDLVVGGSPGEVVGVDTMLLSPWAANTEFLEAHDAKQSTPGLEETWDTMLLGSTVGVGSATQSLAELKPLPPFAGYTGHLSINGIQGHHYHTIASSAQRPTMGSTSPTQSTNPEYYESSVVSSSTPCPQVSPKSHQKFPKVYHRIQP